MHKTGDEDASNGGRNEASLEAPAGTADAPMAAHPTGIKAGDTGACPESTGVNAEKLGTWNTRTLILAFGLAVTSFAFAFAGLHVGGWIRNPVAMANGESMWTGSDHGSKTWAHTNDTSGAPLPAVDDQRIPFSCMLSGPTDLDTNNTYEWYCPANVASSMFGADCLGFDAASSAMQAPVRDAAAAPTAAAAQLSQVLLESAEVRASTARDRCFTGHDFLGSKLETNEDSVSHAKDTSSTETNSCIY